jgi:hypothetical protein
VAKMLHRYYTDHELTVLCQDCARERREAGERCEWAETPAHWEQADLACADCGATVEELSQPEPPDLDTLMRWMHDDGGCEAACPYGCWVEPDGRCPHGKPSWLIVMGLI